MIWFFVAWLLMADGTSAKAIKEYDSRNACEEAREAYMPPTASVRTGTGVLTVACQRRALP